MGRMRTTQDAIQALSRLIEAEVQKAAGENVLVSREEQEGLSPLLQEVADSLREDGGPGTRVRVEALVAAAADRVVAAWHRTQGWLDDGEVEAVAAADPVAGEWTRRAREALDEAVRDPIREWFETFDFYNQRFSELGLPDGDRVDAREGQPARAEVPPAARAVFDAHYRAEAKDIGSVSLHRGVIEGRSMWAVYTSTDGDDAYLEVMDQSGQVIDGARLMSGQIVAWDTITSQVRLSPFFFRLDEPASEDGLSEVEERAGAEQVPADYRGELRVEEARLTTRFEWVLDVDLGALQVTLDQRRLIVAALSYLWEVHLRFRSDDGRALELRPNGFLRVGDFTRPTPGIMYRVGDWRDIDDGSYVLYFQRTAAGLTLRTVQFDN